MHTLPVADEQVENYYEVLRLRPVDHVYPVNTAAMLGFEGHGKARVQKGKLAPGVPDTSTPEGRAAAAPLRLGAHRPSARAVPRELG